MANAAIRRSLATLNALVAVYAMYRLGPRTVAHDFSTGTHSGPWLVLWLPVSLLFVSAILVHRRSIGAQLLARAIWWSNLVLGVLISSAGNGHERKIAVVLALASGLALLVSGREQLETSPGRFAPIAFRGSFTAILVMALADVQSLFLFGMLSSMDNGGRGTSAVALLSVAIAMMIAVIGLFRLRAWGLVLAAISNVALVLVAMRFGGFLPELLIQAYVLSAAVQLALMVPIVRALLRGGTQASPPKLGRRVAIVSSLFILGLMALSLYLGVTGRGHH